MWFILLPFLGMLFYQPLGTAVWSLILLDLLLRRSRELPWCRLAVALAAFSASLLLSFAISKILAGLFLPSFGHSRMIVVALADIPDKLTWFLGTAVPTALTLLGTHPSLAVGLAVLAFIATGLAAASRSPGDFATAVLLTLAALILANLPLLIPAEKTGVRVHVILAFQATTLVALACHLITGRWKLASVLQRGGAVAGALALSIWAGYAVIVYVALPQAHELAAVERKLAQSRLPENVPIVLIGLPSGSSMVGRYCDEAAIIGCASSSEQQSLPNMVRLLLRKQGMDTSHYKLLFVYTRGDPQAISFEPGVTTFLAVPRNSYYLDLGRAVLRSFNH